MKRVETVDYQKPDDKFYDLFQVLFVFPNSKQSLFR